jgi:hypothetical protein
MDNRKYKDVCSIIFVLQINIVNKNFGYICTTCAIEYFYLKAKRFGCFRAFHRCGEFITKLDSFRIKSEYTKSCRSSFGQQVEIWDFCVLGKYVLYLDNVSTLTSLSLLDIT